MITVDFLLDIQHTSKEILQKKIDNKWGKNEIYN